MARRPKKAELPDGNSAPRALSVETVAALREGVARLTPTWSADRQAAMVVDLVACVEDYPRLVAWEQATSGPAQMRRELDEAEKAWRAACARVAKMSGMAWWKIESALRDPGPVGPLVDETPEELWARAEATTARLRRFQEECQAFGRALDEAKRRLQEGKTPRRPRQDMRRLLIGRVVELWWTHGEAKDLKEDEVLNQVLPRTRDFVRSVLSAARVEEPSNLLDVVRPALWKVFLLSTGYPPQK